MTDMQDDMLNEDALETLVRSAVLAAVEQREPAVAARSPDNVVMFGPGASAAVQRAVMATVKELLGKQMLMAGPLGAAATKVASVSAQAEEVWSALQAIGRSLDELDAHARNGSAVLQAAAAERQLGDEPKPEEKPTGPEKPKDEPEQPKPEQPKPEQPKSEEPKSEEPKSEEPKSEEPAEEKLVEGPKEKETAIIINGREIAFLSKSPPAFRSFFREFVETIKKGPVRPSWALDLAHAHGWKVVRGTVAVQVESYIGDLSKWSDDRGERWWSLPERGETPTGSGRKARAAGKRTQS